MTAAEFVFLECQKCKQRVGIDARALEDPNSGYFCCPARRLKEVQRGTETASRKWVNGK